jgi:hypothetical protein
VLSDRLAKAKVICELEGEGDAVDLEGDAGAVGRFYSQRGEGAAGAAAAADELRLDLKGVVYEARVVPSATCMIVKLEGGEARVEAVMNEYMVLRREALPLEDDGDGGYADGFTFAEDSERSGPSRDGGGGGSAKKGGKRKREAEEAGGGGSSSSGSEGGGGAGGKSGKKPPPKKRKPAAAPKGKGAKAKAKPGKAAKKPAAGAKRKK